MPGEYLPPVEESAPPLSPGARFAVTLHRLTPTAVLTPFLIAVNVAVWIAMLVGGANPLSPDTDVMRAWGADFGPLTANGEWWRLFTSNYLHFGAIHLFCNMFALWQIGALVERLLGRSGFLITYVISGVAGSLASLWWQPYAVGAGASGAVFGVYGALLGFITRESGTIPREVLSRLRSGGVTFLGYNLIFGLSIPGISLAAHAGGLAAGFLCGALLSHPLTLQGASTRVRRSLALATLGAVGIAAAISVWPPPFDFEGELQTYRVVAGEANDAYNAAASRLRAGSIDVKEFARVIDADIVPKWRAEREGMSRWPEFPSRARGYVSLLDQHALASQRFFELASEAARDGNGGKQALAAEEMKKLEALEKQMNAPPGE